MLTLAVLAGLPLAIAAMGSLGVPAAIGSLASPHQHDVKQQINNAASLDAVADVIEAYKATFDASHVALAFERLAVLWQDASDSTAGSSLTSHPRLDPALTSLGTLAMQQLRNVDGQGLGLILWAYAKFGYAAARSQSFLEQAGQEALRRLSDSSHDSEPHLQLGAQALSNMVYAFAALGHHPGIELLSAIAKGVQSQLRDFLPQVGSRSRPHAAGILIGPG